MLIIDSIALVDCSVVRSFPVMPNLVSVTVSSRPSRSDAAAPGMVVVKLGGEASQAIQRASVVVLGPRSAQLMLDLRPVALGQVIEHVSLLVAHATVNGHRAEDVVDRGEVCVADDLAELLLGFEHPGGRPAQRRTSRNVKRWQSGDMCLDAVLRRATREPG
jgi:hypothetical protein